MTALWAAFHLSLTLLGTLSDSGLYLALEGTHLPFALYSQTALLPPRARVLPECHRLCQRFPTPSRRGPRVPQLCIRDRLSAFRSPLLCGSRLISAPGLIDMLKFSPYSRAAQDVSCVHMSGDARRELHRRCTARGQWPETFEDRRVACCRDRRRISFRHTLFVDARA